MYMLQLGPIDNHMKRRAVDANQTRAALQDPDQ